MSGVLISGGTQPLGFDLAEHLLRLGRGPVLLVGVEAESAVRMPGGVHYRRVDLTQEDEVRRELGLAVRDLGLDAIVNLAFHRDPWRGRRAHRFNVEATRTLLGFAEDHEAIRTFVHRSSSMVYAQNGDEPDLIREDRPLNLGTRVPPWIRDRVEVDTLACSRSGLTGVLRVGVLRCSEILAPDMGSQLYDYLSSRVCLRRMGFDPMLNLLSLPDAVHAFTLALEHAPEGPVNIPGADTLPLSRVIRRWGRTALPVPSQLLGPLYALRHASRRTAFQYRSNLGRFHYNGVIDGTRAREELGYVPSHPIDWPGVE